MNGSCCFTGSLSFQVHFSFNTVCHSLSCDLDVCSEINIDMSILPGPDLFSFKVDPPQKGQQYLVSNAYSLAGKVDLDTPLEIEVFNLEQIYCVIN